MDAPFDLATTDRLLSTTRAVRKRLDLERPVERSVVERCIEIAMQAPSGSNRQTWQFVLVDDPAVEPPQRGVEQGHAGLGGRPGLPREPVLDAGDHPGEAARHLGLVLGEDADAEDPRRRHQAV